MGGNGSAGAFISRICNPCRVALNDVPSRMEPRGFEPRIQPCHGRVIPFHYGPGISAGIEFSVGNTLRDWRWKSTAPSTFAVRGSDHDVDHPADATAIYRSESRVPSRTPSGDRRRE